MKRLAVAVLCLSALAYAAPKSEAPAVKVVKAPFRATAWTAKKTAHGVAWLFKAPAPAKKADGTGPIQTCPPHHICPPVPHPPA